MPTEDGRPEDMPRREWAIQLNGVEHKDPESWQERTVVTAVFGSLLFLVVGLAGVAVDGKNSKKAATSATAQAIYDANFPAKSPPTPLPKATFPGAPQHIGEIGAPINNLLAARIGRDGEVPVNYASLGGVVPVSESTMVANTNLGVYGRAKIWHTSVLKDAQRFPISTIDQSFGAVDDLLQRMEAEAGFPGLTVKTIDMPTKNWAVVYYDGVSTEEGSSKMVFVPVSTILEGPSAIRGYLLENAGSFSGSSVMNFPEGVSGEETRIAISAQGIKAWLEAAGFEPAQIHLLTENNPNSVAEIALADELATVSLCRTILEAREPGQRDRVLEFIKFWYEKYNIEFSSPETGGWPEGAEGFGDGYWRTVINHMSTITRLEMVIDNLWPVLRNP